MNNEQVTIFVPGRLCIFGEHSDWSGQYRRYNSSVVPGICIVSGTEQGIYADARKNINFCIINGATGQVGENTRYESPMKSDCLETTAQSDSFFSYCAGTALYMMKEYSLQNGIELNITKMTLPVKAGLSSSAAICVLIVRAFNILYELNMSTEEEMFAAYMGECLTKSRCGRMDQACAYGTRPIVMTFDSDKISTCEIKIAKPVYIVFCKLNGSKNTIKILQSLNKAYPFPYSDSEIELHNTFGKRNNAIVTEAVKAMENGAAEILGRLMQEAQKYFDDYVRPFCPDELNAPNLHRLLSDDTVAELTYGGKGVGSGGDGCAQFVARNYECQNRLIEYLNSIGYQSFSLTIGK